jgi:hypothetical protein
VESNEVGDFEVYMTLSVELVVGVIGRAILGTTGSGRDEWRGMHPIEYVG